MFDSSLMLAIGRITVPVLNSLVLGMGLRAIYLQLAMSGSRQSVRYHNTTYPYLISDGPHHWIHLMRHISASRRHG